MARFRRFTFSLFATVLLVTTALATVTAQTSTGGFRGFVRDGTGGALAGVTVEAASPARIGGAAVTVTDSQGLYRFDNLPVGNYTVTFTLSGFTSVIHQGMRVEVGRTLQLDAAMEVGGVSEALTVTGQAPVVDATNAGFTTTFNSEMIQNVPSARTSYFDLVTFAPAVRTQPTTNSANFTIHGSGTNQNSFQYDGIEISSVSGGGVWDFPAFEMAQEVEVKGVGVSAEYAGFQGGVVNIVTRSGSNDFSGNASYFFYNDTLVGNNQPNEVLPFWVDYNHQGTVSVGGPIKQDRVWFLVLAEHVRRRQGQVGVDPQFVTQPTKATRPFGKGTFRISQVDTLDVSLNNNVFDSPNDASRVQPFNTIQVEHGHNPVLTTRWNRVLGAASLLEVRGGGIFIRDRLDPTTGDLQTPGRFDEGTGFFSVNAQSMTRFRQNRVQGAATLSRSMSFAGSHDVKVGGSYSHGVAETNTAQPQNVFYTDRNGAPSYLTTFEPTTVIGRIKSSGIFIQDYWTPTERLVLSLGVRGDFIRGDVPEADKLDFEVRRSVGERYPALTNLVSFNHVDPRVGATVRLDARGKTVAKASFGRYHGALVAGMFSNISPGAAVTRQLFYNPATGAYDIPGFIDDPRSSYAIDRNLSNQFTDQLFAGIERELFADFGVDVSFVWKKEKNVVRVQDLGGTYVAQTITDTFRGQAQTLTVFNRVSPSQASRFTVVNTPDFPNDYRALIMQASKRFSRGWQALGAYTLQRARGWASGSQSIGAQGYGITGFGRDPNDLINAYGRTSGDSTHSLRLSTTAALPWGVHLGLRYSYDSGRPYGRVISVRLQQGTRSVLAQPRGAYELPPLNDLQARLDKDFRFGGARRVRLSLDIFNMLNKATFYSSRNNSSQGEATFGQPLAVISPRRATLGMRFDF